MYEGLDDNECSVAVFERTVSVFGDNEVLMSKWRIVSILRISLQPLS